MDLGAESSMPRIPNLVEGQAFVEQWAAAGIAVPRVPVRRASWRSLSSLDKEHEHSKTLREDTVDHDCGICFEYAIGPCRILCCGKIFCTEHLADWLHGPNAEGQCPNCENACSLEEGTLSLATPSLKPSSAASQAHSMAHNPSLPPSSPCSIPKGPGPQSQKNTPSTSSQNQPSFPGSTSPFYSHSELTSVPVRATDAPSSSATSSPTLSTAASVDTASSSSDEEPNPLHKMSLQVDIDTGSNLNLSTPPFFSSWGTVSRFMSIVTFLIFIYKLLS